MKNLWILVVLFMLPMLHTHRLLGSWSAATGDVNPIEDHLSPNALRELEKVVDHANTQRCEDSQCDHGLGNFLRRIYDSVFDLF